MNNGPGKLLALSMLGWAVANAGHAAEVPVARPPIAAIYSDVCFGEDSGDLIGDYIIILSFQGYESAPVRYAIHSVGPANFPGPGDPSNLHGVQISGHDLNLFTLYDDPKATSVFRGTISDQMIVGKFSGVSRVSHLRRIANVAAPHEDCADLQRRSARPKASRPKPRP
jgi:hypothetical protein